MCWTMVTESIEVVFIDGEWGLNPYCVGLWSLRDETNAFEVVFMS